VALPTAFAKQQAEWMNERLLPGGTDDWHRPTTEGEVYRVGQLFVAARRVRERQVGERPKGKGRGGSSPSSFIVFSFYESALFCNATPSWEDRLLWPVREPARAL